MTTEQFEQIKSLIPKTLEDASSFYNFVTIESWIECIELLEINLENTLDYIVALALYQKAYNEAIILLTKQIGEKL